MKGIAKQKLQFISEIEAHHKEIKLDEKGKSILKDADPSEWSSKHYSINDVKPAEHSVSSYCGITAVLMNNKENLDKFNQIEQFNNDLFVLNNLYKELNIAFKGKTLSTTSFAFLEDKLKKNALQCDYLYNMLNDNSKKVKENLVDKILKKINSKTPGPEIANTLVSIANAVQHDLSESDQKIVNKNLAEALSKLEESDNLKGETFKTLKNIAQSLLQNESLLQTLPVVIKAFEKTDFDAASLSKLAVMFASPEHTKPQEQISDFLTAMNEALSDRSKSPDFMNNLISFSERLPDTVNLTLSILEQFHYRDPALCSHRHEAYVAKNIITTYIKNLPEDIQTDLFSSLGTDNPNRVEEALDRILNKPFSEIKDSDYITILNGIDDNPKFKNILPMWQVFLNAGWQHTVIRKQGLLESDTQDKKLMPINASTFTVRETADGGYVYGDDDWQRTYISEVCFSNINNLDRFNNTKQGITHSEQAGQELGDLKGILNTKFSGTESYLAVMNSTDQGKSLLALDQMREEAVHLQGKYFYNVNHADKTAEELLTLKIPVASELVYGYAKNYGILTEKTDTKTAEVNNPFVLNVIDVNKAELKKNGQTIPDNKTIVKNCTKVAASIKVLGENLVDDLYTYNNANLEKFGLTDTENLRVSKESVEKMKQYNLLLLNKNAGLITEEQFENEIKALNMDDLNKQFDAAMDSLKQNIKTLGTTNPLTKVGELLVKKFSELYYVRYGAELSMAQVSAKMTDELLSDERYNDEEAYKKNPQRKADGNNMSYGEYMKSREEELKLRGKAEFMSTYAANSELFEGKLSVGKDSPMSLGNVVINEIMLQCDLSSDMENAISDALSKQALSEEDKRLLIHHMNQNHGNANLDTLTDGDKLNTELKSRMISLIESRGDEFNSKLNEFINKELNAERQLNSYGVLLSHSYEVKDASEVDEILSEEKIIGKNSTESLKKVFDQQRNVLLAQVEYSKQKDNEIKKISGSLNMLINPIYKDDRLHTYLRFAGSYAASKMNYAGSQELFNAYHKMSEADQKKAMDLMMQALTAQHFEPSMARMLIEKRVSDPNSNSLVNGVIRSIRRAFYGLRSTFGIVKAPKVQKGKEVKLLSTIPAVKEFISSISKGNVLSVSRDFNFKVDPLNPLYKVGIIPADLLPVRLQTTLAFLGSSGLTFSRDNSGRFHIHADLSKLGFQAGVGANMSQLNLQGTANIQADGERMRVTDFAFEDDEAAVLFISKMLCGVLTDGDINTARNLAVGHKTKVNTGISVALGSAPFQGLLNAPVSGENAELLETVLNGAGSFGVSVIDNINFGRIGSGLEYNYSTSTSEGISGTTVTTTHQFTVSGELNLAHGGAYDDMLHTVANVAAPEILKATNVAKNGDLKSEEQYLDTLNNVGNKINNALNHKIVKDVVYKKKVVHYPLSSVDPKIPDGATHTFSSSKLTKAHIDMMKKSGLVSEETIKAFEKVLSSKENSQIGPVHTVFKLKQSAILEMKAHPEKISSVLDNDDNYEFERIALEMPQESSTVGNGLAQLVSSFGSIVGISYTNKNTAQGNQILSYKAGVLQ